MKKIARLLLVGFGVWISLFAGSTYAEETTIETTFEMPELYIKAVNPGYTVDGVREVGEMIEIGRKKSDNKLFSLAGIAVSYTNSSGNESILLEFPENSFMTSEALLLSYASSPQSELASLTYTKTLAMKGGLKVMRGDAVLDEVCWSGKEGCSKEFKSSAPTTLVRNMETGAFEHLSEYDFMVLPDSYYVEEKEEEGFGAMGHCRGLEISEILSYYDVSKAEQFVEIYNNSAEQVLMDGCVLRYKNKNYLLNGILRPEQYFAYYPTEFALTKNPTNANYLEIVDVNDEVVDKMSYPNGQRKGTAYAMIGYDKDGKKIWRTTYAPTPGEPNNYQEYRTCEEGKVINEETGNCVKVAKITTKTCPAGQYLSVLTGRCRKYQTETVKMCKEGYFLNPETGRCKKIRENDGAEYDLKPETYEEKSSFVALYAILIVVGLVLLYVIYEFRHEIWKLIGKVFRRSR